MTQNHRKARATGVLLAPVLIGTLVLTFAVMQARTTTVHAPGQGGRREYGGDVYAVRLSGTSGDAPGRFTASLTARQAAALSAMSGVASVSRLPARATLEPTLSDCAPTAGPAAPAPLLVPSPSPLPAPSPPADDGGGVPARGHAARTPFSTAIPDRPGSATTPENEAAEPARTPPSEALRSHDRPRGKGAGRSPATSKSPAKR